MKKLYFALSLAIALIITPTVAHAAGATPVSGLTVSPAIEQINLAKDQANASFAAQVTNNTGSSLLVSISTNDFTALNQTGGIALLAGPSDQNPHGLASWMTPSLTQLALAPYSSQTVPVAITGTDSLAPGGHYGVIIYKVLSNGVAKSKNQVNINQEVSSLVFLTTYSGGTQTVRLDNTPIGSFALSLPQSVNVVLTNVGNTQTAPRGLVLISGPSGTEVARGIINIDSGLILPETSRLYTISLSNEHKFIYPGTYHLNIIYQADNGSKAIIYTKSFVIINKPLVLIAGAFIVLVLLLTIRSLGPVRSDQIWTDRPKS
jgi:hypothetical protein